MEQTKLKYPIYDRTKKGDLKPGLYLGLLHGFKNEEERSKANQWGEQGAVIGPLKYVHTTYASNIHLQFESIEDAKIYGFECDDPDIDISTNGCVVFDGMEYGDWTVYVEPVK